jgi:hypothetical protein
LKSWQKHKATNGAIILELHVGTWFLLEFYVNLALEPDEPLLRLQSSIV